MAIKKQLTCKTYLKTLDEEKIVARLDHESYNAVITEQDECEFLRPDAPECVNRHIRRQCQREYLIGEIADRLYEYEQLGYEPDELRLMIMELKARKQTMNSIYGKNGLDAESLYPKQIYVTTARCNGKTDLQRRIYEAMYIANDIASTRSDAWVKKNSNIPTSKIPEIKDVIFNDPATIVFWGDGTKTVVKTQDEAFDPEKGLAMAICKKVFGNKGNYFNQIKKWTEKYEEPKKLDAKAIKAIGEQIVKGFLDGIADGELPWKIWVEYYDNGELCASAVLPREYKRKSSAVRAAHRQYDYRPGIKWTVSQTNPWTEEKK